MSLRLILGRCYMSLCQMCCLFGVWDKSYNNFNGQRRRDLVLKNCWGVCIMSVSSGCQTVALAGSSFEVTNQGQFIWNLIWSLYCSARSLTAKQTFDKQMQCSQKYFILHILSFPVHWMQVFAVICGSQLLPLLISTGMELVFAETACDLFLRFLLWSEL